MFSPAKPSQRTLEISAPVRGTILGSRIAWVQHNAGKCSAPGCTKVAKCHLPKAGPVLGRRKSARQLLLKLHLPFSFHPSLGRTFVATQLHAFLNPAPLYLTREQISPEICNSRTAQNRSNKQGRFLSWRRIKIGDIEELTILSHKWKFWRFYKSSRGQFSNFDSLENEPVNKKIVIQIVSWQRVFQNHWNRVWRLFFLRDYPLLS